MIRPSPWVVRHANRIAPGARVLDLACGSGRHARWLAEQGFQVVAVDRDATALANLVECDGVTIRMADLEGETWPLDGASFAGIVVCNYLWRPRLADVLALLEPGGILIYETFMVGNARYGKPTNPAFLLHAGELKTVVIQRGWRVLDFVEGLIPGPEPAMRQAICAKRD